MGVDNQESVCIAARATHVGSQASGRASGSAFAGTSPGSGCIARAADQRALAAAIERGVLFWWDPLNAVPTVHPDVVTYQAREIVVVQDGAAAGRTQIQSGGARIHVGVKGDQARFESLFLDTLNGRPPPAGG